MVISERSRRRLRQAAAGLLALGWLSAPASAVSGAASATATGLCGSEAATGRTQLTTSDGQAHSFHWRVPSTPVPPPGRPVLIWLHGDGGDGSAMAPGFWPATDPDGAIIVTPNGTDRTWNHRAADGPGSLDSQFLSLVIDRLRGCDSVDPDRIFVGGTSRGAFMPYYLLQRSSTRDKIAAVAVNAGLLYCQGGDGQCEADSSDPVLHGADARVIHLHGTDDQAVAPPPTAAYHDPVDWDVDWRVFNPMRLWAEQNGCFDQTTGGANNGVLRETYRVSGDRARVYDLSGHGGRCDGYQLILVQDGGHVIRGQEARIWAFLMDRPVAPTCGGAPATVVGSAGADVLDGTPGPDVIVGLGGADTLRGLGGSDRICGGGGGDRLVGGSGADRLWGQAGRDRLAARDRTADRRIDCGGGRDPRAERDRVDPRPISCG